MQPSASFGKVERSFIGNLPDRCADRRGFGQGRLCRSLPHCSMMLSNADSFIG